jgi:hypothetical protein
MLNIGKLTPVVPQYVIFHHQVKLVAENDLVAEFGEEVIDKRAK